MNASLQDSPLYQVLNPKSVVFFGASNRFTAMGSHQLNSLLEMGFPGPVYPVHPKEKTVQGLTAYGSAADLPETPDLAVMVLPTDLVADALAQCGRKGIKRAVIVSGGFNEAGPQGTGKEQELLKVAREYGIRLVGPNCIGVANPHHGLNTAFHVYDAKPGFIGMASQSGSFVTQMYQYMKPLGLGFSAAVSVGNQADLDLLDCLEYLAEDPNTKVIALYVEGLKRGREFMEAARRISPKKPIVAYYVGGSETGRKAGFSHTGALAGPDKVYDGLFRQAGIVRAASVEELFNFAWVLGSCPPMAGRDMLVLTHSGGPGAALADALGRAGLRLSELSAQSLARLEGLVPKTASLANPVDLTFTKDPLAYAGALPAALIKDENSQGMIMYTLLPGEKAERVLKEMGVPESETPAVAAQMAREQRDSLARISREGDKPFIGFTFWGYSDPMVAGLREIGFPVLDGPVAAARSMAALASYSEMRQRILASRAAD